MYNARYSRKRIDLLSAHRLRQRCVAVLGGLLGLLALETVGALVPPTLSPANGVFSNRVMITLSAPPVGASNLVSYDAGSTWSIAGTTLSLDGYGQGSASLLAKTQSGAAQSTNAPYGPFQFFVAATGVVPDWQTDHSSVAITLTNATTNAVVAWQNAGGAINSNNTFSAGSPRTVTLYGFKGGYLSSTNAWVLRQSPPPVISPGNLALCLTNLTTRIGVTAASSGGLVSVRRDAVFCAPPAAENSSATWWWNVSAFDPLYWHTNVGPWQSYVGSIAAYSGPAAASTFGNGPCAIYTNLLLGATAAATNELVSTPAFSFYPLVPSVPVIAPNGGTFSARVAATLSFPLAEQFGYSTDNGTNWILSYYSGVSEGNNANATVDWFNSAGWYLEGPQGYPVKDWPHFSGGIDYSFTPDGVIIWSLDLGPGSIESAKYATWDHSTRLNLPLFQPPDATNQVAVVASGFNAFWQTNRALVGNGYGSEPTGGNGPWPAATPAQSALFTFQLPVFAVTTNWAPDHTSLSLDIVQPPANANVYYTLDGSVPSAASSLLLEGDLTNWTTTQLILTGAGVVRFAELGWDTDDVTALCNGLVYKVADRGLDFRGYASHTWSNAWLATAGVVFNPPPGRYYAPTSTALTCASPGSTIWVRVTPDPGNDTNLVGVSGSPMGVDGAYGWNGTLFTNELNGAISLGYLTNAGIWSLSWAGLGVLYTSTNLYGSQWTATTNGVSPAPITSTTVGWHRYSAPVTITTNTLVQAYAFTANGFASAVTNGGFAFGNPNPLPISFQYVDSATLRFSWATNAGTVNVLFSPALTGPWTNVYSGPGVVFGTNGIHDFPLTPPRGFYRFSK